MKLHSFKMDFDGNNKDLREQVIVLQGNTVIGNTHLIYKRDIIALSDVFVLESYRRKGVLGKMINHIREQAELTQRNGLRLTVDDSNFPALKAYEKYGFIAVDNIDGETDMFLKI